MNPFSFYSTYLRRKLLLLYPERNLFSTKREIKHFIFFFLFFSFLFYSIFVWVLNGMILFLFIPILNLSLLSNSPPLTIQKKVILLCPPIPSIFFTKCSQRNMENILKIKHRLRGCLCIWRILYSKNFYFLGREDSQNSKSCKIGPLST